MNLTQAGWKDVLQEPTLASKVLSWSATALIILLWQQNKSSPSTAQHAAAHSVKVNDHTSVQQRSRSVSWSEQHEAQEPTPGPENQGVWVIMHLARFCDCHQNSSLSSSSALL